MKVAIKYCGGCNPDYDRVALVRHIEKGLHGKVEFVSAEDEDIDLVLAVEGCKTACADLSAFKGTKVRIISKVEDVEEFLSIEQGAGRRMRKWECGMRKWELNLSITEGGRLRR